MAAMREIGGRAVMSADLFIAVPGRRDRGRKSEVFNVAREQPRLLAVPGIGQAHRRARAPPLGAKPRALGSGLNVERDDTLREPVDDLQEQEIRPDSLRFASRQPVRRHRRGRICAEITARMPRNAADLRLTRGFSGRHYLAYLTGIALVQTDGGRTLVGEGVSPREGR